MKSLQRQNTNDKNHAGIVRHYTISEVEGIRLLAVRSAAHRRKPARGRRIREAQKKPLALASEPRPCQPEPLKDLGHAFALQLLEHPGAHGRSAIRRAE
jgi:hypothetical protein